MSIFTRPDSPPPRQPSPELVPAPLPCPPPRHRHSELHLRARATAPHTPPGLHPSTPRARHLTITRSLDDIPKQPLQPRRSNHSLQDPYPSRSRIRSTMPSATSGSFHPSTSFLQSRVMSLPSHPSVSSASGAENSIAVLPLPSSLLSVQVGQVDVKNAECPTPLVAPVYLPDMEQPQPTSDFSLSHPVLHGQPKSVVTSEKHKTTGITRFKFFTLRNASRKASKIFAF
ncbi:hypothetical protein BDQ17DRAFT_1349266 [Cyathus striatus]|nr:hypothetical protein BDQ17DRAFT_1349266 [Cyathus striatus]